MKKAIALLLAATPLAGCHEKVPPPPSVADYSCLTLPSELEQPGVVISRPVSGGPTRLVVDLLRDGTTGQRNEGGVVFREAGGLDAVTSKKTGEVAFNWSISILDSLLKTIQPGLSIGASGNARRTWPGTVEFAEVVAARTFDEPLGNRTREWAKAARRDPNLNYFLIRDALVASKATIDLDRNFAIANRLQAGIEKAAEAEAKVAFATGASYRLTSQLSPPRTVCVILDEIKESSTAAAPATGAAAPGADLQLVRTTIRNLAPIQP